MTVKKPGLGRGLDALLRTYGSDDDDGNAGGELRELPLDAMIPGPHQPRRRFDEAALESLSSSIRAQGVVQPIVVRPGQAGRYEIVAGERRWRAAKLAGLSRIPAVVRSMETRAAMTTALVENIQRADLNPLEQADALRQLIDECSLTHEQAAEAVGRSRTAVSNILRLLDLHPEVQALVRDERLSLGHSKVLLGVNRDHQPALAQRILALGLSVRQTERLARIRGGDGDSRPNPGKRTPEYDAVLRELRRKFGAAVRLVGTHSGGGRLIISFKDQEELARLLAQIKGP